MKMKKNITVLITIFYMLTIILTACKASEQISNEPQLNVTEQQSAKQDTTQAVTRDNSQTTTQESTQTTTKKAAEEKKETTVTQTTASNQNTELERVHLTIAWNESWANTSTLERWPKDIANAIFDITGVEFEIDGMDDEKFKVLLAGGDLPDIVFLQNGSWIRQLIEGNQIIALDDLLQTNGKDILKTAPKMPDLLRKYQSNNTGLLYALGTNVGKNAVGFDCTMGYFVRWDLYKELGYPEVNNLDDYIQVIIDMQALYPVTEDGKPVYGAGAQNEWWNALWAYDFQNFRAGWWELSTVGYKMSYYDNHIINDYTDINGPLWETLKFLNRLDREGLFDRDSFAMKASEYEAKMKNGQYVSDFVNFWTSGYNTIEYENDKNTMKSFLPIPVEGASSFHGSDALSGVGKFWTIASNCKIPDRAMDLINFFFTSEGIRMSTSGLQGQQWDIIDGKAALLQSFIDNDSSDLRDQIGIGFFSNFLGHRPTSYICDDGEIADLFVTTDMLKKRLETSSAAYKDYCKYYNVDYPSQAIGNMIDSGLMVDEANLIMDLNGLMTAPPDDIKRIDANLDEIVKKMAPLVIMAADDTEFERIRQETLNELDAANIKKSEEWWFNEFNTRLGEYMEILG